MQKKRRTAAAAAASHAANIPKLWRAAKLCAAKLRTRYDAGRGRNAAAAADFRARGTPAWHGGANLRAGRTPAHGANLEFLVYPPNLMIQLLGISRFRLI